MVTYSLRAAILLCAIVLVAALSTAYVSRGTIEPTSYLSNYLLMSEGQFKQQYIARGPDLRHLRKVQVNGLSTRYLEDPKKVKAGSLAGLQVNFREEFERSSGKSFTIVPATGVADANTEVRRQSLETLRCSHVCEAS